MKKAKLEMETLGKILLLTAFLIIFLLMFKGCKDQMQNVGMVGINEYVCWFSQTMKTHITTLIPSACQLMDIEKKQDSKGIATLMRKCWWLYGQGDRDTPTISLDVLGVGDYIHPCYVFTPDKDINVEDFKEFLRTRDKNGKEVTRDSKETAWRYIQKEDREKEGVCFDKNIILTDGDKLQEGKNYYILFYDDKAPLSTVGKRDRIMISRDLYFGVNQLGVWNTIRELITGNMWCRSREDFDIVYEEQKKTEEEQAQAKKVFNDVVNTFQDCMGREWSETCRCDDSSLDPSTEIPTGYSIQFKKIEEKKYSTSLWDPTGKVYTEKGISFTETLEGDRVGLWVDRLTDREGTKDKCLPGVISASKVIKSIKDYYIIYHKNSELPKCFIGQAEHNPQQEDFSAVYFVQRELTGFKKCSELS